MNRTVTAPSSIGGMWMAGLGAGVATLRRDPVLGLKRLILPVSYWRAAEFAYVARHLHVPPRGKVLDLGSPKDLAIFFARKRQYEMVAVDILTDAVETCERYARAQGISGHGPGKVYAEVQDGRALVYETDSFDGVFSVSVIEHIPDHGDSAAIAELVRVVKPGGRIVITVPYDHAYRETFVDGAVYERETEGRNFFERHYDERTLQERLIEPSGARLIDLQLWGERGLAVERLLSRVGPLRIALSPLEAAMAQLFLHRVDPRQHRPMAAFVTLEKPAS